MASSHNYLPCFLGDVACLVSDWLRYFIIQLLITEPDLPILYDMKKVQKQAYN